MQRLHMWNCGEKLKSVYDEERSIKFHFQHCFGRCCTMFTQTHLKTVHLDMWGFFLSIETKYLLQNAFTVKELCHSGWKKKSRIIFHWISLKLLYTHHGNTLKWHSTMPSQMHTQSIIFSLILISKSNWKYDGDILKVLFILVSPLIYFLVINVWEHQKEIIAGQFQKGNIKIFFWFGGETKGLKRIIIETPHCNCPIHADDMKILD